jgi:hypothetical protein
MANGVQLEMAEPTAGDQIPPAHAPRAFGRFLGSHLQLSTNITISNMAKYSQGKSK